MVLHAVADALLGAAALGDLGEHFPDTDEAWRDADSAQILARVAEMIASRGLRVGNVDVNVHAESPRIAPRRDEMRANLASVLGIPQDCLSIKARTAEGLGPVGCGEAIAADAVVLLEEADSEK